MTAQTPTCTCLICQPHEQILTDELMAKTAEKVREHGWSVLAVRGSFEGKPDWSYTVGLWHSYRVAEMSMFCLNAEDMVEWLNVVGHLVSDGLRPGVGTNISGVIDGFDLQVRPVHPRWYEGLFGRLLDFYAEPPPMFELIWPDANGKWPWEDGASRRARECQPRLWIPVEQHDTGPWREIAAEDVA